MTEYDVDSLSVQSAESYQRAKKPTFSALGVQEVEFVGDVVNVKVVGTVATGRAYGAARLSFEVADRDGNRLD